MINNNIIITGTYHIIYIIQITGLYIITYNSMSLCSSHIEKCTIPKIEFESKKTEFFLITYFSNLIRNTYVVLFLKLNFFVIQYRCKVVCLFITSYS